MRCNQNQPSIQGPDTIRAFEATIEDISITNQTSHVTISYGIMGDNCLIHMTLVTLIVTSRTRIQNSRGQTFPLRNLRKGMKIDALFSTRMTMSIPPQATAYRITVLNDPKSSNTTTNRIISIDTRNQMLTIGNTRNVSSIINLIITNATIIQDRRGARIRLQDLRVGQLVEAEHASFQTLSIPPQTNAFRIQVL